MMAQLTKLPSTPARLILLLAGSALLSGCALGPKQAPKPLPVPALSAQDISKAEQKAYWQGFAAGRRYERKHGAVAATPTAPGPAPAPAALAPAAAAPAPAQPLTPAPLPPNGYVSKGAAQPVALPAD